MRNKIRELTRENKLLMLDNRHLTEALYNAYNMIARRKVDSNGSQEKKTD